MPFIIGAAFFSVITFSIITIKKIIIPLFKKMEVYYYAGFNINLNNLIENIKTFSIFILNLDKLFWFFLLIILQFFLIIFAYRVTKKKFHTGGFYVPFAFLFIYSYTIFIAWLGVMFDLIKGKKQKW